MTIEEFSGWTGAILVLIAYYMVSSGKAKADAVGFQLINIIGASFLIFYTHALEAYASMAVNGIWVGIGLCSFIKLVKSEEITHKLSRFKLEKVQIMNFKNKLFLAVFSAVFLLFISGGVFAQDNGFDEEVEMNQESRASEVLNKKKMIQQEQEDEEEDESEEGEESISDQSDDSEEIAEEE
jgi:mannitol-specific phosphotransferase system IIBC component